MVVAVLVVIKCSHRRGLIINCFVAVVVVVTRKEVVVRCCCC